MCKDCMDCIYWAIPIDYEPCSSCTKSLGKVNFRTPKNRQEEQRETEMKIIGGMGGIMLPRTESDPTGREQHAPGAKLDAGKLDPDLILGDFPDALLAVIKIGTDGAKKYTEHGWLSVPNGIRRYTSAMWRHWFAEKRGELIDQDSGSLHAAHCAWNALARLQLMLAKDKAKKEND